MSREIDQRVVEMQFDNSRFERNVDTSMKTIDKLKEKLNFDGQAKSFDSITKAAEKVDVSILEKAADAVGKKFSAMEVMAITAISNVTNRLISGAENIINQVSDLAMAEQGWDKYNKKVQAVQTIMKATGEDIDSVSFKLQDLSDYTDKTSYSYSQMVDNIGKFTANGVALGDAIKAIEGVANVAALSGVGATDPAAARAMYNFSQALAAGSVKMIDWKSIENANMATKQFKEQIIKTAKAVGTLNDEGKTLKGTMVNYQNFRETLSESWFTSDVLIATLKEFADAESDIGKQAYKAAAEAKTFQDALGAVQDALSSSWSTTFEYIFGNYEEATKVFTGIQDAVLDFLVPKNERRNTLLYQALVDPFKQFTDTISKAGIEADKFNETFDDILRTETGFDMSGTMERLGKTRSEIMQLLRTNPQGMGLNQTLDIYINKAIRKVSGSTKDLTEVTQEYENLLDEIFNGKWGHGAERFAKLIEAGYDDDFVQNLVNKRAYGEAINWEEELADKIEGAAVSQEDLNKAFAEAGGLGYWDSVRMIGEVGGFSNFWIGIKNLFEAFVDVVNTVKQSFRDIFPPITALQLYNFIERFREFSERIKPTAAQLDKIRRTFSGLFSILKLGVDLITAVGKGVLNVIKAIRPSTDTVLDFTASIGDNLKAFSDWVHENEIFTAITNGVSSALQTVIGWISKAAEAIRNSGVLQTIFGGIASAFSYLWSLVERARTSSAGGLFAIIGEWFKNLWADVKNWTANSKFLTKIAETVETIWTRLKSSFEKVVDAFKNSGFFASLKTAFSNLGNGIKNAFSSTGSAFANAWVAVKTFWTDIYMSIWGLFESISNAFKASGYVLEWVKGVWDNLKNLFSNTQGVLAVLTSIAFIIIGFMTSRLIRAIGLFGGGFESLADTLWSLSKSAKKLARAQVLKSIGDVFLKFGEMVLMIAGVITVLSFIEGPKLANAASAFRQIGIVATVMLAAVLLISRFAGEDLAGPAKLMAAASIFTAISGLFTGISYAVMTLVGSLGDNPDAALRPMRILLGSLLVIMLMLPALNRKEGKAIKGALAIAAIGVYLKLATDAIKELGSIPVDQLARGVKAVIVLIGTMLVSMLALIPLGNRTLKAGAGIFLVILSLGLLVNMLKKLASQNLEQMIRGLQNFIPLFGVLLGIAIALIPARKTISQAGFAMLSMSVAIGVLALVIAKLGNIDSSVLDRGMKMLWKIIAVVVVLIAVAAIFTAFAKATTTIEKASATAGLAGVKRGSKTTSKSPIFGALIGITVLLTAMSVIVALLGLIPQAQLRRGLTAAVGLGLIISGIVLSLAALGQAKDSKNLFKIAIVIAAMLVIMGGILLILQSMDNPDKYTGIINALATLIVGLAAAFFIIVASTALKPGKIQNLLPAMVVLALLLVATGIVLAILNNWDINDHILEVTASFSLLLLALALAFEIIASSPGLLPTEMKAAAGVLITLGACLVLAAAAIGILQAFKVEGAIEKATALGLLLIALSGAFAIIAKANDEWGTLSGNQNGRLLGTFAVLAAALVMCEAVLKLLEILKIDVGLKQALLLGAMFAVMIAAFVAVAAANDKFGTLSGNQNGRLLGTFAVLAVAIAMSGLLLKGLELLNIDVGIEQIGKLALMLGMMIAATAAIGAVGTFISFEAVKEGLEGFMLTTALLALFITGIGGTARLLESMGADIEDWADHGIDLLIKVGEAIGRFIGALIGSAIDQFLASFEHLPEVGGYIAGFAEQLGSVDKNKMEGVESLAAAIITLTANSALSQLMEWFGGETSYESMFDNLSSMADGIVKFVDSCSEIDEDDIVKAELAAKIMEIISAGTPRSGGLVGLVLGDKKFDEFGDGLGHIGEGIAAFSDSVKDVSLDSELVDKAESAGKIMEALADATPRSGGLLDMVLGSKMFGSGEDDKGFAGQLATMATGIKEFEIGMADATIGSDLVTKAENAGKVIEAISDAVPRSGGLLDMIFGGQDFTGFVNSLPIIAQGIRIFELGLNAMPGGQIDMERVNNVLEILRGLSEFRPSADGFLNRLFGGDQSLGSFSTSLPDIGRAMKEFTTEITSVSGWKTVSIAVDNLERVVEFATTIHEADMAEFFGLSWNLETMSKKGFDDFIAAFGDESKISALQSKMVDILQLVINAFDPDQGGQAGQILITVKNLASSIIDSLSVSSTGQDVGTIFKDMGSQYISRLSEGIEAEKDGVINTVSKIVEALILEIGNNQNKDAFIKKGNWIIYRIAEGLKDETALKTLNNRIDDIVDGILTTMNTWTIYNKFVDTGKYFLSGLRDGLDNYWAKRSVYSKAEEIANNTVSTLRGTWSISSPSKVAEKIGSFFTEGLGIGLMSGNSGVQAIAKALGINVTDEINDIFDGGISTSNLFSGVDLSSLVGDDALTLTPVLDLSEISSGVGDISSMFGGVDGLNLGATGTFDMAFLTQQSGSGGFDLSSAFNGLSQQMADFINTPNTSITNTFNITGDDPGAIADEVSKVISQQTQREAALWA